MNERTPRGALRRGSWWVVLGLLVLALPPTTLSIQPASRPTVADRSPQTQVADSAVAPVVAGYTAAQPLDAGGSEVRLEDESAPSGALPVTSVPDDPRCGRGFTSIASTGSTEFTCIHTALDQVPPVGQPLAKSAAGAAAPPCIGNGVNGPRIQLIYMYVEGQPDRTATVVPRIINQIAPRMDAVFRETSKTQGREIGMRLHMPGCKLSVDTVMIDADNGEPDETGAMLNRITRHLAASGYDTTDRKYVLWFDGGNEGACGVAPFPESAIAAHVTDNAVVGATSDLGWQNEPLLDYGQGLFREVAISFRWGFPALGDQPPAYPGGPTRPECWGRGATGAFTEVHELIHLLGAVNLGAPNSNGLGHCTDDHDILCYGEQGVSTIPRCATPVEQLDCGSDDYFNSRPPAGSYLSTHWNTANSRFLGAAPVHDAVPAEIPRP